MMSSSESLTDQGKPCFPVTVGNTDDPDLGDSLPAIGTVIFELSNHKHHQSLGLSSFHSSGYTTAYISGRSSYSAGCGTRSCRSHPVRAHNYHIPVHRT